MTKMKAIWTRAYKTLIQSAIGAGATACLSAIGSATTLGEVNWGLVASSAILAMIVSILMNIKANLPEVGADDVD